MAKKSLFEEVNDAHREYTKNFNWFMSVLWAIVGWTMLLVALLALGIAYLNPFWFRESLLRFVAYDFTNALDRFRKSLFQNYTDKVNLFDTLKNVK